MNNLKTEWINRLDDLINKLYDIQIQSDCNK